MPEDHASAWHELLGLLDVQRLGPHSFRGSPPSIEWGVPYGGLLLAQALAAATRTVDADLHVRSLHCYFVQAGSGHGPVAIEVHVVRDGRSTGWRTVEVTQSDRLLLRVEMMFASDSSGPSHQAPRPDAPDPEQCPKVADQLGAYDDTFHPWDHRSAFDLRYVTEPPRLQANQPGEPRTTAWIGRGGEAPVDRGLCAALLTYASDLCMLDACLLPHGLWFGEGSSSGFSLDHSVWFHAPARVPQWMLMTQSSPGMREGRGLSQAQLFADDGQLLLSIAQLGSIRPSRR
ncbi:acyl-CoA thioesterase II [Nocardioides sp. BGMRC 2183]|nr:acyl-CoA thioesterase II [Nocardioides sp. BGMRC 2183]